jgi:glutathione S-transferase
MIELHEFEPAWGINPSPFCLKVETYLRLAGLPFRAVPSTPFKAPKGKLPFITDNGHRVGDSGHIIAYLQATYGDPLDHGLSAEQQALGHVLRRTCEESLYFVLLYSRWLDEPGWEMVRQAFFGGLPPVARDLVPRLVRRTIARSLRRQGYGRHSRDEIYALGIADLDALATHLGGRPFAVADRPTSVDASVYSFLVSVIWPPIEMPLKRHALTRQALCAYLERMEPILAGSVPHRPEPR